MSGLNRFDIVYYINLEHRTDRFEHINNELKKTNIDKNKINKINGIYLKNFGILGCAKSHIKTLEEFINSKHNNCIIFEDDFTFTQSQKDVNTMIDLFFRYVFEFDILMLSANILNSEQTPLPFILKIKDAQTLSGYCVSKKFAPILLENFKESVSILEKIGQKIHNYCFDIYMKKLQPISIWLCLNPRIGKQIDSYSDIEEKHVIYNC
jgi:glycosyl transferase family 25